MDEIRIVPVHDFVAVTAGLIVFLLGAELTRKHAFLRNFNIPEPVSGGIAVAAVFALVRWGFGIELEFDLSTRDTLLVMFFTTIGLNARLSDITKGGVQLAILLAVTVGYLVIQNIIGRFGASLFGLPDGSGILLGSAALIGGHGTVIAWAPVVEDMNGMSSAMELGVSVATLGLIVAAIMGGPIAKFLIARHKLTPDHPTDELTVGTEFSEASAPQITSIDMMRAMLGLNLAVLFGYVAWEALGEAGINVPLFMPCLFVGIILGNLQTVVFPRMAPISHTPALGLISEYALGVFLAMSLMSMQLWTLSSFIGPLVVVIGLQAIVAVAYVLLVVFPAMGRNYDAAVISSGFGGIALGATPTAVANMTAVTKRHGPSPIAFIVLPLVSAFFIDIANAFAINFFLNF